MKNTCFKIILILLVTILILPSCSWDENDRLEMTYIVITFDDQHASIYDHAFPLMSHYGFRATNAINTGDIGSVGKLSWQQVEELEFVYGWETAGHTLNHVNLSECTDEEALYQIEQDWLNLRERGLSHQTFVLPRGRATNRDYQIIKQFYHCIRTSKDSRMFYPLDQWNIGYFSYLSSFSADDAIRRITEGIFNKEVLIVIGFHRFNEPDHSHNCSVEDFNRILMFIHNHGLPVTTLKEVCEILR